MVKITNHMQKQKKVTVMRKKQIDFARKVFAHNISCKDHKAELDAKKIRDTNTEIRRIECKRLRDKMK